MGQYYKAINVDKKEYINPHAYDCGAKLMEFSYIDSTLDGNDFTNALHSLMQNEWRGDRVYVVGDYADFTRSNDIDDLWLPVLEELKKEFKGLGTKDKDGYEITLYSLAYDFNHLLVSNPEPALRYMYNSKTKEYIDLKDLPVQWTNDNNKKVSIDPLPLLICIGNDRGGGDFHRGDNIGYDNVGYWAQYSQYIFFDDKVIDGYTEFNPDFLEKY